MKSKTHVVFFAPITGLLFVALLIIGIAASNLFAEEIPDACGDNENFTTDFLIDGCHFKTIGANPYFILKPGYQRVLESDEEMSIETVLCKTKTIVLAGRRIKTRVYQERAYEWDDGEWVLVEISSNYFAICKETGDVYYFGEWSRDCEEGFDENNECEDENNIGSWEAGIDGARPGIMMPGTFLLGARYFQEIAPPDAVDRGENAAMGLEIDVPAGSWSGCVQIFDTNPAAAECGEDDAKIYCPGVGLVQDADMELVEYGFAGCNKYIEGEEEAEE